MAPHAVRHPPQAAMHPHPLRVGRGGEPSPAQVSRGGKQALHRATRPSTSLARVGTSRRWASAAVASCALGACVRRRQQWRQKRPRLTAIRRAAAANFDAVAGETDVVIIGSGLGGLSCAGVLAAAGRRVTVCETHYHLGGACHTFKEKVKDVGEFHFESGPSLYSGLSMEASPSQLKHVFQIVGEEPEWICYDRWNAFMPEGEVNVAVGYSEVIDKLLPRYGGPQAVQEWQRLMTALKPYSEAVYNSPPFCAIREDPWAALTIGRYWSRLKNIPGGPEKLSEPFGDFLQANNVSDEFIKNYLGMFCFLLQGLPSYGAPTSMMAYMMADLYRGGGTTLDYPKGGSKAIVDALVRGITKRQGCEVLTRTHVEEILVEDGRACGVRLKGGKEIRAREVVSNADVGITKRLVPKGSVPDLDQHFDEQWRSFAPLNSFIHIHLGFHGKGLPTAHCPEFPAQWGVVNDWSDLESPRNMVLVSVPSLLDQDCAPKGYHALHAYTPATEPWADWDNLDRNSEAYKQKKAEAADFLYSAIEKQIPDIRERVVLERVGTPLTHERFLRKPKGAYGWRVLAGSNLPGHKTPLPGLHICGDSTYPGIGVPAAAMGGHICANNMLSPLEHWNLLDRVKLWDCELEM